MAKEQLNIEFQNSMDDIAVGRVISSDEPEAEIRKL